MKRTPLKRKTPLRSKRAKPRRDEGRVQHKRMRGSGSRPPTAEERRHMDLVASLCCLISGRPAVLHHLMHAPGKERRRDHRFVVPLAPEFHNGGDGSVHALGSEKAFEEMWGVDLIGWGITAWSYRDQPEAPFWTRSVERCRAIALPKLIEYQRRAGSAD